MKLAHKISLIKSLLFEVINDFDKGAKAETIPHLRRRSESCKQTIKTILFNNFGENQPHNEEDYELKRQAVVVDQLITEEVQEVEIHTIYYNHRQLSIGDHIEIPGYDHLTENIKKDLLSFKFILIDNEVKIQIKYFTKTYIFSLSEISF